MFLSMYLDVRIVRSDVERIDSEIIMIMFCCDGFRDMVDKVDEIVLCWYMLNFFFICFCFKFFILLCLKKLLLI